MVRSTADRHADEQEHSDDVVIRTVPSHALAVHSKSIEIKPKSTIDHNPTESISFFFHISNDSLRVKTFNKDHHIKIYEQL